MKSTAPFGKNETKKSKGGRTVNVTKNEQEAYVRENKCLMLLPWHPPFTTVDAFVLENASYAKRFVMKTLPLPNCIRSSLAL